MFVLVFLCDYSNVYILVDDAKVPFLCSYHKVPL